VVALADERAEPEEPFAHLREVGDRVDLPSEVVEADASGLGERRLRSEREEAEIVVVLRAGGAHEDRRAFAIVGEHLEPERLRIERGRASRVAHVEDRVVEPANSCSHGARNPLSLSTIPGKTSTKR
jgi:hypothetical protein